MNSWKIGVENLKQIIKASSEDDLSYADKCALYSAARFILDDIRDHATNEDGEINGYLSEKAGKTKWHIGAIYGFDVDNGHDTETHRVWAYGQLGTLENLLREQFPDD